MITYAHCYYHFITDFMAVIMLCYYYVIITVVIIFAVIIYIYMYIREILIKLTKLL